jgi:D-alanyl-D-alanine carboxypeptidase
MRRVVAAVLLALVVAGCSPDPTSGRPPAGPPAVAFRYAIHPVGPGTPWPLTSSWRAGCPVAPAGLRLVEVTHWGYDGKPRTGRIVVAAHLATKTATIFRTLYAQRFQIQRMEPVDAFGGSDGRSMAANNTSGFNCRRVAGTSTWSEHAFGTAIDVNPVQNPWVSKGVVDPPAGSAWLYRASPTPGMIIGGDATVQAFASQGFKWGGYWTTKKDYQHFSTSGR